MPNTREILKRIVGEFSPNAQPVFCKVTSRDDVALICVCAPISGIDAEYPDVRLVSGTGNGMILFPQVGSIVLVQPMMGDQTAYLAMVSQLDKIQFLDGSYGGLVEVANLTSKLNNLENLVNDLISKYNLHTHVLTLSSGTGTAAPTVSIETGTLTPTVRSDIENTKVTHGNI